MINFGILIANMQTLTVLDNYVIMLIYIYSTKRGLKVQYLTQKSLVLTHIKYFA